MPSVEALKQERTTIERVDQVLSGIWPMDRERKEIKNEPAPVKINIVPGAVHSDFGRHSGHPSFYYIRSEDTEYGRPYVEDNFEHMAKTVLGEMSLQFRADSSTTPEQLREKAEALKAKLENPETQRKIRELYAQTKGLKKDLLGY